MNQEPVAWTDGHFYVSFNKTGICSIPLYTHPVKELTDEEILAIADKFIERFEYEPCNVDEIGFARAIEERHGIK